MLKASLQLGFLGNELSKNNDLKITLQNIPSISQFGSKVVITLKHKRLVIACVVLYPDWSVTVHSCKRKRGHN